MFFASLTRGNPDPKSPLCKWPGTQAASQSTWDITCALSNILTLAAGKHMQECGILSHLGSVDLQILSNILQDAYLTVCRYQKDPHYAVVFINKTIYCFKLKIRQ